MRRYEILLPLRFNDGAPVPDEFRDYAFDAVFREWRLKPHREKRRQRHIPGLDKCKLWHFWRN